MVDGRQRARKDPTSCDRRHTCIFTYLLEQTNVNFVSKAAFSEERNLQSLLKVQKKYSHDQDSNRLTIKY